MRSDIRILGYRLVCLNFNGMLFNFFLGTVSILLFSSHVFSQNLSTDFNRNGKEIRIICLWGPTDDTDNYLYPKSSDSSVAAIKCVTRGMVKLNGKTFEQQVVRARIKNTGFANIIVGTETELDTFEIPAQNPLLSMEISGMLPDGTLPAGNFLGLDQGKLFNLIIKTVKIGDCSVIDVPGSAALKLEGSPAFSFEGLGKNTLLTFKDGMDSVNLLVADRSMGESAKLHFVYEGTTGPVLISDYQIPVASVNFEESTRAAGAAGIPLVFSDAENMPMAVMTFSQETLDSVRVRTFKGTQQDSDPSLLLPLFSEGNLLPRYSEIEAFPGGAEFNASLSLYYDEAEFLKSGIEDENELRLMRFNGSGWDVYDGIVDPENNFITVNNISGFSIWAFGNIENSVTGFSQPFSRRGLPAFFSLEQNYPNPFNPNTAIRYQLPVYSSVDLSIFNISGQKVVSLVSGIQPPGIHKITWDAGTFSSGIYFYRLETGNGFTETRKLILLK